MTIDETWATSPVGDVWWAARDGAVVAMGFDVQVPSLRDRLSRRFPGDGWRDDADAAGARGAIAAYFAGDLRALASVRTDASGPPFHERVWRELRAIPPGATTSYGALALALGSPRSARAVGSANARNPISLIVPCHRVIGAAGDLCGYAGGERRKRWLLAHEALFTRAARPRTETAARDRALRASSGFAG